MCTHARTHARTHTFRCSVQLVICGDFNLPDIDWSTGTASTTESIHNYFTKIVKDNYLWQMVNFSTRNKNVLDLVLTNIPNKVNDVHGFDDIISTDHKLISFNIDLRLHKKPIIKRTVYNFKNADWSGLKDLLKNTPWLGRIQDSVKGGSRGGS